MSACSIEDRLETFEDLDWSDAMRFGPQIAPYLTAWAGDRNLLRAHLRRLADAGPTLGRCEFRPGIDKIVLAETASGRIRLRMHIYRGGGGQGGSIPHDHRWSFTSVVLRGSLRHAVYARPEAGTRPRVTFLQDQPAGTIYSLQGDAIHTAHPEAGTVTLFVRGPSDKPRATFVNPLTGSLAQRAGEDDEMAMGRGEAAIIEWAKMSPADVRRAVGELEQLSVI